MNGPWWWIYGRDLMLTVILELFMAWFLFVKEKSDIKKIVFINAVTNPLLHAVRDLCLLFMPASVEMPLILALEVVVVICEGAYFRRLSYRKMRPVTFSLALNSFSFFTGMLIFSMPEIMSKYLFA